MNPRYFLYALALLCAAIWSADIYYESGTDAKVSSASPQSVIGAVEESLGIAADPLSMTPELSSLLAAYEGEFALGERAKAASCAAQGPLPDPDCTPGAVFPEASTSVICVSGYTQKARNVSTSLKKKVYAEYGLGYPQPTGSYEVDHLIPLELGGSNDIANLFPEAAQPAPGFREKDLVEDYLHLEVCSGRADLKAAQQLIARDWPSVYEALPAETLAYLRQHYRSWAPAN